ncbi:40S ribosomal protein S8 [Citrus sinensis]|nr:40S ribosomal protein S8 [Citrus sinensis]
MDEKRRSKFNKTREEGEAPATDEAKKSNHVLRKLEKRRKDRTLDPHIEEQFGSGRLLACVSSPPGHCGRADGYWIDTGEQDSIMVIFAFFFLALMGFFISDRYILEKELEFYMKKIQGKKGRGADVA